MFRAILTFILIAQVNIQTRKSHRPSRQAIINLKDDNPWHTDGRADCAYFFMIGDREFGPAIKIVEFVLGIHHLGDATIEHAKGMLERSNVHRHKISIKD